MTPTAWEMFDALVRQAERTNPWHQLASGLVFQPDFVLLGRLLGVPLSLASPTQSGTPAKALDVWLAHELRRAGFGSDEVWPRAERPRVLPHEVALLLGEIPAQQRSVLGQQLIKGVRGVSGTDARVLGKNYIKQVDVVIAQWQRGPELLVSTKRMDSSFGKNALNRVEESYGDAKNLRGRHPLAALGFLFALRSTAWGREPLAADRIVDLLIKLGREDDAYDTTAMVVLEYDDPPGQGADADIPPDPTTGDGAITPPEAVSDEAPEPGAGAPDLQQHLDAMPKVTILHDRTPPLLNVGRFLALLVERVLDHTPVELHALARRLRAEAKGSDRLIDGGPER